MKFDAVFLDADDTILDYRQAERQSLERSFAAFGLPYSDAVLRRYHDINQRLWEELERGEVTREWLRTARFARLFSAFGLRDTPDCLEFNRFYMSGVSQCGASIPGAQDLMRTLSQRYPLYITSNASTNTQESRLIKAGLMEYVSGLFVSEDLHAYKPDPAYFDAVFQRTGLKDPKRVILLGDSLTSDMRGGRAYGLATCWFNPKGGQPNSDCDYVIQTLDEFVPIVQ